MTELAEAFSALLADDDTSAVPQQPASTQRQTIALPEFDAFLPRRLSLIVDAGPGCGGVTWPAALVLSRYLAGCHERSPGCYADLDVLELGSGTGVVALALAALEPTARIVATDIDDLVPLMAENIALNDWAHNVRALELPWGTSLPREAGKPSLILAADCVYFEPAFPLLVDTLVALLSDGARCLFCYKRRRKADKRFFVLLRKRLQLTEVLDDPDRDRYSRDGIHLYIVTAARPPASNPASTPLLPPPPTIPAAARD